MAIDKNYRTNSHSSTGVFRWHALAYTLSNEHRQACGFIGGKLHIAAADSGSGENTRVTILIEDPLSPSRPLTPSTDITSDGSDTSVPVSSKATEVC